MKLLGFTFYFLYDRLPNDDFRRVRRTAKSDFYLRQVCPPETARLPLDGFPRNLIFEYFSKMSRKLNFH
jgi:hypothetical protein